MSPLASVRVIQNENGAERSQRDCQNCNAAFDLKPEAPPYLEIGLMNVWQSDNDYNDHEAVQAEEKTYTELLASLEPNFPE